MRLSSPSLLISSLVFVLAACSADAQGPTASSTASADTHQERLTGSSSSTATADPPFDPRAAARALASIDFEVCRSPDGPTGPGHVTVTFENDGTISRSVVDAGPFPGTSVGNCLAALFQTAVIPPFSGAWVRVGKSFTLP